MLGWRKDKLESKTARKNINNLRYADDTTLTAESEEELKSLLMKVKEESKSQVLVAQLCPTLCDPMDLAPEKAMAPHSSTLAWKIPWVEKPGRQHPVGSQRGRHG